MYLVAQSCLTLCNPMDCSPPGSSVHGDSLGKNTGVVCCILLQGIFPTQGSNPGLLHYRWILYCLSNQGSPGVLEGVAYPFSRGSSQSRNWTGVSCIASGFFTSWATREVQIAVPFSRGSSQPRDQTQVSHIAGKFFTTWATREAQEYCSGTLYLIQKIFPTQESNQGLQVAGGFFTRWTTREACLIKVAHLEKTNYIFGNVIWYNKSF